jgi:succinate-acetate transporter protein
MATISERDPTANAAPAQTGSSWVPANPAPLGLLGFGGTTLVLSLINTNLIGVGATPVVLGMAFAYGGLAQFMAGMWEFRTGNTFGAAAFTTYGAFWLSFFFLVSFDVKIITPIEVNPALGAYLWTFGIITGLFFLCTFAAPRAIQGVFLLLTITFILLGIGNSGADSSIIHAGGWVGLATAALAMYAATAEIMADVYGHDVLPVGRHAS